MLSRQSIDILATVLAATLTGGCAGKLPADLATVELPRSGKGARGSFDPTHAIETSDNAPKAARQVPAMVVHIDPITGQILPTPPAETGQIPEPQQLQSYPAPAPEFLEVPSAAPGGGVKVNLNRQFHQSLVATIDSDGKMKLQHQPFQQTGSEPAKE